MVDVGSRLGPYEITGELGAGGMGVVYRARDSRLGREVAVKVLPGEVARDGDRVARFEREARALAALSHPNILAIHDVGREGEVAYAVTELLDGETLRDRLSRERLPWRRAVEIGAAIADGLASAHEHGVVHRDLKPENLFLTSGGRVKILDFGLARLEVHALQDLDTLTSPPPGTLAGAVLGTVGYMSPEQVRGAPADARSDIFALGCVLYEMLTGERAFKRDTTAEAMTAILREPAPEVATSGLAATPELNRIVAHCLEKQPAERFQSASDVAFALRSLSTGGTVTAATPTRRFDKRVLVGAAAAMVVAAGAVTLLLWKPRRAEQAAAALDPKRIVVAVFENHTGDPSLDPLGRMASDWLTQGLSRIGGLEVVPSTSVLLAQPPGSPAPARRDPLRALAEETGAGTVVSGAYYLQGQTLYLQARVTDALHQRLLYALDPASGPAATPLQAIDNLRRQLMGGLATTYSPAASSMLEQQRPPTYEAYGEFIKGFEIFLTDNSESLRHMERAADIDPDFAGPLMYAAYLRRLRGDWAEFETLFERINEKREQLTPFGRHFVDGVSAWGYHRYGEALQAMRSARELAPRDPFANLWVGMLAVFSNRPEEAAVTFGSVQRQPFGNHPLGTAWVVRFCDALHVLGRNADELKEARRGRAQFVEDADVRFSEIRALVALGRVDEMRRVLQEAEAVQMGDATPADAMLFAARELRAHGHRDESLRLAECAVAWYLGRPPKESATNDLQRRLGDALFGAKRWHESRALFEKLVAGGSEDVGDTGMVGVSAARAGDRVTALKVAGGLARLDRDWLFGEHTWYRAAIAASLGEKERAVELLREAFAEGQAFGTHVHSSLELEPLWDYPPFVELLRPKG